MQVLGKFLARAIYDRVVPKQFLEYLKEDDENELTMYAQFFDKLCVVEKLHWMKRIWTCGMLGSVFLLVFQS